MAKNIIVKRAVIPAAGLGTRFLPVTKASPKEMLPIYDKPAIQYIVEEAITAGLEDILIVTGRGKQAIENHFDKSFELEYYLREKKQFGILKNISHISEMVNIHYVRQKEPLGLGHAVLCAKSFIGNEPFALFLADDIIDASKPAIKQLVEVFEKYKTGVIGIQEVPQEKVSSYGIIKAKLVEDRIYKIEDLFEKPSPSYAPSNLAVVGRYILPPEIMDILPQTNKGHGGEIQLTDALRLLNREKPLYALQFIGKRYDVGEKIGYLQATIEFALKDKEISNKLRAYLKNL
jgi:UTP--glucose-1-phosphate uridylyltransferase